MSTTRVLVFTPSFIGTKSSLLWSRIFEEYQSLTKKFKLVVMSEEISAEENENLTLIKVSKISISSLSIFYRMIVFSLATIRNRKKYDLVFIRVLDFSYMFAGLITKKILKKKLVVWISNTETGHSGFQRKIYRFLYKKTLSLADVIGLSSEQIVEDINNYIGFIDKTKISIIKQGINLSRFTPDRLESSTNVILYIGRISKVKGIEDIIHAIPIIKKTFPDITLKIIGTVQSENQLNNLKSLISKLQCENNVNFVGPVPHELIVQHYRSSNVFVLPSRSEGQSNVILEAMACEKPVVVTPVGTIAKIIQDGVNGFFVNPNQPQALAEKIITLLQDKEYREKIGKAARKTIEEHQSWDSFIDGLGALFSKAF